MENNERREFLKKIAYKAPAVIALGTLIAPASANASKVAPDGDDSNEVPLGSNNDGLG